MSRRSVRITAIVLISLALLAALRQLVDSRTYQLFGSIVARMECARPVVALTFDDGPTQSVTQVLETLRAKNVKATFFVVGQALAKAPQLGRQIAAAGHELGNHSYSHRRMVFKSWSFIDREIRRTDQLIRATGYQGTITFRPPYGKKLVLLPYYLHSTGRTAVTWDVEPESDAAIGSDPDRIVAHVLAHARAGSIILLHPMFASNAPTRAAVGKIIDELAQRGYEFTTVSKLTGACSHGA